MEIMRIPALVNNTFDGMLSWFSEMSVRELLFHPDDLPEEIVDPTDGVPVFTEAECRKLDEILGDMFREHGDFVHEACYPILMHAAGQYLDG